MKGRQGRIEELIKKYKYWDALDNRRLNRWTVAQAKDNKRKIKKVFLKEMHEPIENFL